MIVCIACVRQTDIGCGEDRRCAVIHSELVNNQAIDLYLERQRETVGWLGMAVAFAIRKRNCETAQAQLDQMRLLAHHQLPGCPIQRDIMGVDHEAFVRITQMSDTDWASQRARDPVQLYLSWQALRGVRNRPAQHRFAAARPVQCARDGGREREQDQQQAKRDRAPFHRNAKPAEKCTRKLLAASPYARSRLSAPSGLRQRTPAPYPFTGLKSCQSSNALPVS